MRRPAYGNLLPMQHAGRAASRGRKSSPTRFMGGVHDMPRINDKQKGRLREGIISGARCYSHYLLNKEFLVVCEDGDRSVVRFWRKNYAHLTGLLSNLNANDFFANCFRGTISYGNINSVQKYDFRTLCHKVDFLSHIHTLMYTDVQNSLFLYRLHTQSCEFPVGIRNPNMNVGVGFSGDLHCVSTVRRFSSSRTFDSEKRIIAIFAKYVPDNLFSELVYVSSVKDCCNLSDDLLIRLCSDLQERFSYILSKNNVTKGLSHSASTNLSYIRAGKSSPFERNS